MFLFFTIFLSSGGNMNLRKIILVNFASLFLTFQSLALSVQSLNIEWFGRGGVISGSSEDEYRSKYIKDFLKISEKNIDVYVLMEITNPELLVNIFDGYTCDTYKADILPHQFVVLCVKEEIMIESQTDFTLQGTSKRLRPAHSVVVRKNGMNYRIIGLHLKASVESSLTRIKQIESLAHGPLVSDERVIIIGDFNTFAKDHTGNMYSDSVMIDQILNPLGFNQTKEFENTFLGRRPMVFDRAWIKGMNLNSIELYGPCVHKSEVSTKFDNRDYYERFVSDHCSLKLVVDE